MKRKNYKVRIKLTFETTMDHSQTSMKKAKEDINRVLTDYLKNKKLFHRPSEPLVILSCFNSFFSESILWFRSHHFFD